MTQLPPVTPGVSPQPYTSLPPAPPRGSNGLGVASLVLGIIALVLAFIPVASFIAWVPALVAVGLGIAGLVARNRTRGTAVAGLVLGAAAVLVSIVVSIVSVAAVAGAVSDSASSASQDGTDSGSSTGDAAGSKSDDSSGTTTASKATVGKPFLADMGNGNVARITIVSAKYKKHASKSEFASDADHGGYLVLDVLWETEKGTTSSNPLYFTAKDAAGHEGDESIEVDDALGSSDIPAGDKSRGNVAFDIVKGPTTIIIDNPIMDEAARLTVNPQ